MEMHKPTNNRKDNNTSPKQTKDSSIQFMLVEFQRIQQGEIYNRSRGESRVSLFVTLCSIVGGLVAVLSQLVDFENPISLKIFFVTIMVAALFLAVIGFVTYELLIERWRLTVVYLRKLARIRRWFADQDPSLQGKLVYSVSDTYPPYLSKRLLSSSLMTLISILNCALIATALGSLLMLINIKSRIWVGIFSLVLGIAGWFIHKCIAVWKLKRLEKGVGITIPPDQDLKRIYIKEND
jgi:hypothetical protein